MASKDFKTAVVTVPDSLSSDRRSVPNLSKSSKNLLETNTAVITPSGVPSETVIKRRTIGTDPLPDFYQNKDKKNEKNALEIEKTYKNEKNVEDAAKKTVDWPKSDLKKENEQKKNYPALKTSIKSQYESKISHFSSAEPNKRAKGVERKLSVGSEARDMFETSVQQLRRERTINNEGVVDKGKSPAEIAEMEEQKKFRIVLIIMIALIFLYRAFV